MESLDAERQAVDDLVLLVETFVHLVFELLSQPHELGHCFSLELLNILVLLLQLRVGVVLEGSEFQGLVGPLIIDLLLQVVLAVVDLLHDVLFALDSRLHLPVELVLQPYDQQSNSIRSPVTFQSQLTIKRFLRLVNLFIRFRYSIFDLLRNRCLKPVKPLLSLSKLRPIVLSHRIDL